MFIFSFIQFWLNDYMTNVLIISNIKTIFITFTLLCFICPVLGNLLENYISKAVIEKEKHVLVILISSFSLISIMSACIPLINSMSVFSIFIWIYFTLANALMSILTSLSLNSNSNSTKQINSAKETFAHIMVNICGTGFGIFLYAIMKDKYNSKFPMHFLINFAWLGLICVCGLSYLKWNMPEIEYPIKIEQSEPQANPLRLRLSRTSDILSSGHQDIDGSNLQDAISIADDDTMSKNDEDLLSISFHLQNQSFNNGKGIDFNK